MCVAVNLTSAIRRPWLPWPKKSTFRGLLGHSARSVHAPACYVVSEGIGTQSEGHYSIVHQGCTSVFGEIFDPYFAISRTAACEGVRGSEDRGIQRRPVCPAAVCK